MSDYAREQQLREERLAALQQRPEFREWLAGQEAGVRTFFTEVVTDMPTDPYTAAGALRADEAALAMFPDEDSADPATAPENLRQIEAFQRYIGELIVRTCEGRWVYDVVNENDGPEPVIELPYSTAQVKPRRVLISIAFRRRGNIAFVLREQTAEHSLWVEHGRLPLPEWRRVGTDLRLKRLFDS